MIRLAALPLAALAVAGCGSDSRSAEDATRSQGQAAASAECHPIEPGLNTLFLLCRTDGPNGRGWFERRGRGRIPIEFPAGSRIGHWSAGSLSPDGRTLLVQWSAECEVPFALTVPVSGGTPRLALGRRPLDQAQPSIGHGWTRDGRAIIEVVPNCGDPRRASSIKLVRP